MAKIFEEKPEKTFTADEVKAIVDEWFLNNFHNKQGISDTAIFGIVTTAKVDLVNRFNSIKGGN